MSVAYRYLSRAELDVQLSPSRSAKDPWAVLARHERETAALANNSSVEITSDIRYGDGDRQRFDICRPRSGATVPCVVFLHGGFWQEGSKAGSGFAAADLAAAGFAHAGIGYTLAPEASLSDIVGEVTMALTTVHAIAAAHGIDASRLIVVGHSAGAHLAAAALAGLGGVDAGSTIAGAVLISGIYDLAPIAASYVNEAVALNSDETVDLSPLLAQPKTDVPVQLLIGADETDAFRIQTEALHAAWSERLSALTIDRVSGRDHFDILDELADPSSSTGRFLAQFAR